MKLKYFGTDGVRGVANQDLSPELAFRVGRAGGYVLTRHSERKQPQVLVSRDTPDLWSNVRECVGCWLTFSRN